jgi:hypothetical protein
LLQNDLSIFALSSLQTPPPRNCVTCAIKKALSANEADVLKHSLIGFDLKWKALKRVAVTLYLESVHSAVDNCHVSTSVVTAELFDN